MIARFSLNYTNTLGLWPPAFCWPGRAVGKVANCSERYPKGFDLVPKEVTLNDYSSNRRGKRIARELHDGYKKDRDPRVQLT